MLQLYNSLTRKKSPFSAQDPANIRLYVCGPTVYDTPHLGNARSVVIYDVLFRLLQNIYGNDHVTYVRNITDVDDKIITASRQRNISIRQLTQEVTEGFHADMAALGCLPPSHEPRATDYIHKMVSMIERLIAQGHAYAAQGHVLFDVTSYNHYGALSGRSLDAQQAGARIEVESYKRHPGDFILWKPAEEDDDASAVFDSPWGKGRPGWHIECSAMSTDLLGENFDIHGGGADLKFPHHENEIAQSCCAYPNSHYATYWVHNGFLTVNGEKMSKSLGNFVTVRELLHSGIKGEVIRYALLRAKYNEPLDWNETMLQEAQQTLDQWYRQAEPNSEPLEERYLAALCDDLNFPKYMSMMHSASPTQRYQMGRLIGLGQLSREVWFKGEASSADETINAQVEARIQAKKDKNWSEADRIRDSLKAQGILLEDRPDGTTDWRRA
jgi:cysteinyl-tRNA synthetase